MGLKKEIEAVRATTKEHKATCMQLRDSAIGPEKIIWKASGKFPLSLVGGLLSYIADRFITQLSPEQIIFEANRSINRKRH
ncbi:hypothetical protein C4559_04270 [Candidatus Microgenomates bacterium]|nr:MAG: hypothetical protein C4559_04270 [Candidatus Microgenomates bacterium]